jgi:OmpA-OmpF porin, OOP family
LKYWKGIDKIPEIERINLFIYSKHCIYFCPAQNQTTNMTKILPSFIVLFLTTQCVLAQNNNIRPSAIGVSFILNDYITPQRVRSTSLAKVFNNKSWAKFNELGTGLAISYFQGVRSHIDFATTLAGTFIKNVMPNEMSSDNSFLLEADATANFKLFSDAYSFTPYFTLGIGASKYKSYYGAILPIGLGLKLNLFDEAAVFISSQYRVPVTTETNNYHLMHSIGIAGVIGQKKTGTLKETP